MNNLHIEYENYTSTWVKMGGVSTQPADEAGAHIKAQYSLRYSHSGCLKLLRRLGFEYRKPKALPRVADETKRTDFIELYETLIKTLPAGEAIYFAASRVCKHTLPGNGCSTS